MAIFTDVIEQLGLGGERLSANGASMLYPDS